LDIETKAVQPRTYSLGVVRPGRLHAAHRFIITYWAKHPCYGHSMLLVSWMMMMIVGVLLELGQVVAREASGHGLPVTGRGSDIGCHRHRSAGE
jgi:hypothetical protein